MTIAITESDTQHSRDDKKKQLARIVRIHIKVVYHP